MRIRTEHTDNPEALGLEEHCIEPGWWNIEGYSVRKRGRSWEVREGWAGGDLVRVERTLGECRGWIRWQ